jgi:hypothetical protein
LRLQQLPIRAVRGIQGAVNESQLRFQACHWPWRA